MYIEKTNQTVIELSRNLPSILEPKITVLIQDETSSINLSLNFTSFRVDDSRVYIHNIRTILENEKPGINFNPVRLTIGLSHENT